MTTTSCPTCGKPIRPGSKFCGSCGSTLAPTETSGCPHCGEPVRAGAKFCSHCGKTIESTPAVPVAAAVTAPAEPPPSPAEPPETSPTAPTAVPDLPAAEPPAPAGPAPVQPGVRRYRYLPWVILILIILCAGAIALGLWIYNPGDIFSKATDEPTATFTEATTETAVPSTEIPLPEPTLTPTIPLPTETEPLVPTATATTEVITPTATLPPGGNVILDEKFDSILAENWRVWGKPRPIIESGFGDNYLSLTSTASGEAGVSSKAEFMLEPGLEMSFGGQLQPGFQNYQLVFSWDPLQYERGPENTDPGVIQMEISRDKVVISAALTKERCVADVAGVDAHDYLVRVLGDFEVALYLDGEAEPVCTLTDIGMEAPIVGSITFRDMGLVSYVKVASP